MSDFVRAESVFIGQSIDTREDMLRFISERAVELGFASDADVVCDAFLAREAMGETGTTHIRLLSKTAVLLMKDDFKTVIRGTDDPRAIADAINAGIEMD